MHCHGAIVALIAASLASAAQLRAAELVPEDGKAVKTRPLAFKHLSKMAGTFVIDVLHHVVGKGDYTGKGDWVLIDELFALTDKRRGDAFVISSARNPCDYYVSLWAFDATKNFAHFSMQDGGSAFFEEGNHNATKFRNWLAWTQSHGHGPMSYRLWETLVQRKDDMTCWDQVLGFCGEGIDDKKVETDLAAWSPKATADCWIHTENLVGDLRSCLEQYEKASGATIDFAKFDSFTNKPQSTGGNHNPSSHDKCESYFDDESAESVMHLDSHLFNAFGYTQCCGHATGPMK